LNKYSFKKQQRSWEFINDHFSKDKKEINLIKRKTRELKNGKNKLNDINCSEDGAICDKHIIHVNQIIEYNLNMANTLGNLSEKFRQLSRDLMFMKNSMESQYVDPDTLPGIAPFGSKIDFVKDSYNPKASLIKYNINNITDVLEYPVQDDFQPVELNQKKLPVDFEEFPFHDTISRTLDLCNPYINNNDFSAAVPHANILSLSYKNNLIFQRTGKPPRVLVVDDNSICLQICCQLLKGFGCSINVAEDGMDALSLLQKNRYDLILMDIRMPRLNGYDCTKRIRISDCITPIISMTSEITEVDKANFLSVGMSGCIQKPFTKDDLKEILGRHLKYYDK
jgi:CheY-like chemotaxis protein